MHRHRCRLADLNGLRIYCLSQPWPVGAVLCNLIGVFCDNKLMAKPQGLYSCYIYVFIFAYLDKKYCLFSLHFRYLQRALGDWTWNRCMSRPLIVATAVHGISFAATKSLVRSSLLTKLLIIVENIGCYVVVWPLSTYVLCCLLL